VRLRVLAPAKVNLCLALGGVRDDGRHELLTLFQSLSLADMLTVTTDEAATGDRVICDGVSGANLADTVLANLRARGWSGPPLTLTIDKRIPVAAGMAGGSADAAATLRLAAVLAPLAPAVMREIAAALGSDIPSQLSPGVSLGTAAGDVIEPLAALPAHAYVVIPSDDRLSTADVYREADRLGLGRSGAELQQVQDALRGALAAEPSRDAPIPRELIVNDLQPAALSLCPAIARALEAAVESGADAAIVSGSGPTVVGIWWGEDAAERASFAERDLSDRYPGAALAVPVGPESGIVEPA
jgi:4-diphosphocytidyl-2-C-methyl-D-erythritol kinase